MTEVPLAYRINKLHEYAPWGRSMSYQLVREGRLPARRLGGATFVLREDLERFLKALPIASAAADDAEASVAGRGDAIYF